MTRPEPHDHIAEAALLASIMADQAAIYQALQHAQPEDFHHRGHQIVYQAAIGLFTKQQAIDPVSLAQETSAQGNDSRGTAFTFITDLKDAEHNPEHVAEYARMVADTATRRRLIALSQHVGQMAADDRNTAETTIQYAMQEMLKLGYRHNQHGTLIPLAELYDQYVDARLNPQDDQPADDIRTGYNALDDIITSLRPSNLVILGARPSIGKSSLALNIGVNAAYQARTVAFFSLEMAALEVALRILAAESGIPSHRLEQGAFPPQEITEIIQYTQELSKLNFFVDESPILSVAQISAKAQAVRIQAGLDLVIIDYLQLLSANTDRNARGHQRVQEISAISRDLKQMARELNVPVIAISQLNRAVEARPGSRPQLSDLRESGSIEQDADIVMFLYRQDRYYTEEEWAQMHPGIEYPENIAEVIVAKHRNGPTGTMELFFQQPLMRFDNLPRDMPAEYRDQIDQTPNGTSPSQLVDEQDVHQQIQQSTLDDAVELNNQTYVDPFDDEPPMPEELNPYGAVNPFPNC